MDASRAALDPRHQNVSLQLLGEEEEASDDEGRRKPPVGDEECDPDRWHGPQEGTYDGNDLRGRHPGPDQEGVLSDGEEHYPPPDNAHDRAKKELSLQVPDQRLLDGEEQFDEVVAHRLRYRAEQSTRDLLPFQQQIYGDEDHEKQVEQGPEDPEHPPDHARRH